MAYGNGSNTAGKAPASSYGKGAPARPATAPATPSKREVIFSTGLFAPDKPGVKSKGSVQVKEDITIPAGSYINLYEQDDRKDERSPVYKIQVTAGKLRSPQ